MGKSAVKAMEELRSVYEYSICRTHLEADVNEIDAHHGKKKTNEKIACEDKNDEDSADYIDGSFSSNIHKKRLLS